MPTARSARTAICTKNKQLQRLPKTGQPLETRGMRTYREELRNKEFFGLARRPEECGGGVLVGTLSTHSVG